MDLARYLGLFVADAREHLSGLEAALTRLEQAPEAEHRPLVDAAFRHLHSLKSSSATMGLASLQRLAHAAEGVVARARDGGLAMDRGQHALLVEACDALAALVDQAEAGAPLAEPVDLEARLARFLDQPARPFTPLAPAAPAPVLTPRPEGDATNVRVLVSARSATPAVRAFLALRRLESLGAVLSTDPSRDVLRAGQIPGLRLLVTLSGTHSQEALSDAVARIPDIEEITRLEVPVPPPPAAFPPAPASGEVAGPGAEQTVRVRVELLDHLLELAGELVLASSRVRERARALPEQYVGMLDEETDRLRQLVRELNNRVLAARQTPVQVLTDRLPRVVRDLSRRLGKPLQFVVAGGDVMLDRGLLDALAEPVQHAIRNAADHGIEAPDARAAASKPPTGLITFAARRERERVLVELSDDGRGFDSVKLRAKAVREGRLTEAEAAALTEEAALRLAFLPGLSTRDEATEVSGRGVGMDAVLSAVEQLGGTVELASRPGLGSTVRLVLPATVSVMNVLLLSLGREVFGVPMSRVRFATEADLSARGGEGFASRTLLVNGERVPAHALGRLLGLPEDRVVGPRPYVVVEAEGQRTAVAVDRLLGQEEVVLRPLGPPLERIRGLSGTAILGNGRPIFVLDVPRLVP